MSRDAVQIQVQRILSLANDSAASVQDAQEVFQARDSSRSGEIMLDGVLMRNEVTFTGLNAVFHELSRISLRILPKDALLLSPHRQNMMKGFQDAPDPVFLSLNIQTLAVS